MKTQDYLQFYTRGPLNVVLLIFKNHLDTFSQRRRTVHCLRRRHAHNGQTCNRTTQHRAHTNTRCNRTIVRKKSILINKSNVRVHKNIWHGLTPTHAHHYIPLFMPFYLLIIRPHIECSHWKIANFLNNNSEAQ